MKGKKREAIIISKGFIYTPDKEWKYWNNFINIGDHRLMKRGMNKRYRIEMYDVESGYCVVVVNKREKTCAAYELPFDMETCGIHFFALGSADMYFKAKCKEHGVESCEVSKLYRWYQKYD